MAKEASKSGRNGKSSKTARVMNLLIDPEALAENDTAASGGAVSGTSAPNAGAKRAADDKNTGEQIRNALEMELTASAPKAKPAPKSEPAPKATSAPKESVDEPEEAVFEEEIPQRSVAPSWHQEQPSLVPLAEEDDYEVDDVEDFADIGEDDFDVIDEGDFEIDEDDDFEDVEDNDSEDTEVEDYEQTEDNGSGDSEVEDYEQPEDNGSGETEVEDYEQTEDNGSGVDEDNGSGDTEEENYEETEVEDYEVAEEESFETGEDDDFEDEDGNVDDYICFNVTQALVEDKTEKYMRMFGMCTCNRCRIDVIALALSNLPAKYVVAKPKDMVPRLSMYEAKYSAAVITQVMKACKKVIELPHHKR